jgi:queuine/archaeosine tRNA-ribosyltransferase
MALCWNGFVAEGSFVLARRARHAVDASKLTRPFLKDADPCYLSGIGVPRSMGTAVTLFFGEPSISRSE